ncbi:hypothetical protein Nm8I071_38800 [Nonomuraea sp. TT08I-71]|nr:hypothetical protein Nm8I071_38800 [Nonomuraea sp. TT08I-71]
MDWRKPFLETAPGLIVVFEVHKGPSSPKPYYVKESVGIAVGFLLAALHQAGLATLTHTPSPMRSTASHSTRSSSQVSATPAARPVALYRGVTLLIRAVPARHTSGRPAGPVTRFAGPPRPA